MKTINLGDLWPDKDQVEALSIKIATDFKINNTPSKLAISAMVHAMGLLVASGIEAGALPCPDCGELHTPDKPTERHLKLVQDDGPTKTH